MCQNANINADSSQRVYQHYLLLLKQEISTIQATLEKQSCIFQKLRTSCLASQVSPEKTRALYNNDAYEGHEVSGHRGSHISEYTKIPVKDIKPSKQRPWASQVLLAPNDVRYDEDLNCFAFSDASASAVDKLLATSIGGLREMFADDCVNYIERRLNFFDQLTDEVDYLDRVYV